LKLPGTVPAGGVVLMLDDGVGEGLTVLPVRGVPFSAKRAGAGLALVSHEPLNPKLVVPPVTRTPFQEALATVTRASDWVAVPSHSWVTVWPAAKDHVSCQDVTGSPRLVTFTFAVTRRATAC
jgi:hypothetical protein